MKGLLNHEPSNHAPLVNEVNHEPASLPNVWMKPPKSGSEKWPPDEPDEDVELVAVVDVAVDVTPPSHTDVAVDVVLVVDVVVVTV